MADPRDIAPTSPLRNAWTRLSRKGRSGDWHYVRRQRLPVPTVLLVLAILAMTLLDGVLTLLLMDHHYEEANPLMRFLLGIHPLAFVVGKYALTAACMPFLLIFGRRQVFLPRLRVAHTLPFILLLYCVLVACQAVALARVGPGAGY